MKKNIDRCNIETGDTLLVSSHSLLSEAIQTFQKCKWNHAAMFVWINGELYVTEANMKGIVITPFENYEARKDVGLLIMRPGFALPPERQLISFSLPYVGHSNYGFFNLLIAQAARYLTRKKLWIGPKRDPKTRHFICGQWVAFVYNHFDSKVFDDWNRLAPEDLFNSPNYGSMYVYQ